MLYYIRHNRYDRGTGNTSTALLVDMWRAWPINQCGQPFRGARVVIIIIMLERRQRRSVLLFAVVENRRKTTLLYRNTILQSRTTRSIHRNSDKSLPVCPYTMRKSFWKSDTCSVHTVVAHPVWAGELAPNNIIVTAVAGAMAFVALLTFSTLSTVYTS